MNKLILAAFLGLLLPGIASAHPRSASPTARVSRNDGDSRNAFAMSITSYTWTVVGSSSTNAGTQTGPSRLRRRALTIQALGTVTYAVCLSSVSAAASPCDDSIPGYEIGAAWGSVSIYDEAIWYARARDGGPTVIKGSEAFDSRDEAVAR
jgi:hypothetical protein